VRITGQLLDTVSGNQIWAGQYDSVLANIFDLQDSVTSNVVTAIQPSVREVELLRAQAKSTESLTAYDLYLRSLSFVSDRTVEGYTKALPLLERAVTIDPNFSSAHGLVAVCYVNRIMASGADASAEVKTLGLQAARRAIETGRNNPDALARGGYGIARLGESPKEGLQHLEHALTLAPNFGTATRYAGFVSLMIGDYQRATSFFQRAIKLSPVDPSAVDTYLGLAAIHFFTGQFEEATEWFDKALGEKPRHVAALMMKAAAMAAANRASKDVEEVIQRLLTINPQATVRSMPQRMLGFRSQDIEAVMAALRKAGLPE
jgi:adenylate cyclase